jgi:RNA polymerase sigma-70 factor (family 1)
LALLHPFAVKRVFRFQQFFYLYAVSCLPSNIEKELLCRVAEGDETAFGLLFNAFHQRLGAYVYRLTESLPATQEIVQDVFVKIWLKRAILPELQHFDAYLFKAARNHVFNYLRKLARERVQQAQLEASLPADGLAEATAATAAAESAAAEEEHLALLDQAIDHLPPQQKKIYLLHRRQGLSHTEIAGRLHLSVETVKKHMSLALRSIREYLSLSRLTG